MMVIDTNTGLNAGNSASARSKSTEAGSPKAPPENASTSSDNAASVVLSNQAQEMSRLEASIAESDVPDNSARIAEIKQAISDGTYTIDAQSIAGNMLDQDKLFA